MLWGDEVTKAIRKSMRPREFSRRLVDIITSQAVWGGQARCLPTVLGGYAVDRDNSCLGRLYINKLELPTAETSHALSHKSPLSVVVARLEFLH